MQYLIARSVRCGSRGEAAAIVVARRGKTPRSLLLRAAARDPLFDYSLRLAPSRHRGARLLTIAAVL
jgi:hypothetical protein